MTSKRFVFRGAQKAVEWAYAKLLNVGTDPESSAIHLQVSNRQKAHVVQVHDLDLFTACANAATAAQGI